MVTAEPDRRKGWPGQRVWSRPSQVEPGTGVAEQLELVRRLASGRMSGADFAERWLAARRRALAEGERVREPFDRVLTSVFYLLDDYVIDATLRDSGDMTDDELVQRVQLALRQLDSLEDGQDRAGESGSGTKPS